MIKLYSSFPPHPSETNPNGALEIRDDDVTEECNEHGGVLHVFVDRQSARGNVYVKCPTVATAVAAVNSLHGRYFAGRTPSVFLMRSYRRFEASFRAFSLIGNLFPTLVLWMFTLFALEFQRAPSTRDANVMHRRTESDIF